MAGHMNETAELRLPTNARSCNRVRSPTFFVCRSARSGGPAVKEESGEHWGEKHIYERQDTGIVAVRPTTATGGTPCWLMTRPRRDLGQLLHGKPSETSGRQTPAMPIWI
jgi:hypothetical protein